MESRQCQMPGCSRPARAAVLNTMTGQGYYLVTFWPEWTSAPQAEPTFYCKSHTQETLDDLVTTLVSGEYEEEPV